MRLKAGMCTCAHEKRWHNGPSGANGPCTYGHDTVTGGCTCLGYRSRRYRQDVMNEVTRAAVEQTMAKARTHHPYRSAANRKAPANLEDADGNQDKVELLLASMDKNVTIALGALASAFKDVATLARLARDARRGASLPSLGDVREVYSPRTVGEVVAVARGDVHGVPTRKLRAISTQELPTNERPLSTIIDPHGLSLSRSAQRIIDVLAQFDRPLSVEFVLFVADYRLTGTISEALAMLRKFALIETDRTDKKLAITARGRTVAKHVPLPGGKQLLDMWVGKLDVQAGVILRFLASTPVSSGTTFTLEQVLQGIVRMGGRPYKMTGATSEAMATLRKLQLVDGPNRSLRLHPEFAEAIGA